jgi:hypothetical protein
MMGQEINNFKSLIIINLMKIYKNKEIYINLIITDVKIMWIDFY